jgi:hypothetical protein
MRSKLFSNVFVCAFLMWVMAVVENAGAQDKGVKNEGTAVWIVRYDEENKNKKGDAAIRLKVEVGVSGGDTLKGQLQRYDSRTGSIYKKRAEGGDIALVGEITKNSGMGTKRRREEFVLVGTYLDSAKNPHVVTIRGFHYTGKLKADTDRADDQIVIKLVDKPLLAEVALTRVQHGGFGGDCDEQPPDEDVLMEDNVADPPPYP